MPFLIETFDKPDHAHVRAREREAHLAFLARHRALLLACGAKLDDDGTAASGGIYIVDLIPAKRQSASSPQTRSRSRGYSSESPSSAGARRMWTVSAISELGRVVAPQPSSSRRRKCATSRIGGAPNSRLYSRLNCDALS